MTHPATILVLEDDAHLMEGIRDILEIQGYKVLTAANGQEGLDMLRQTSIVPDLIVSDIMMPVMDGYRFLETVRYEEKWIGIPFVFLTAKGEKTDVRAGKMLGADDYLVKPFEAEDLVVVVASKLRRRHEIELLKEAEVSDIKRRILTILHHEFRTPLTYVVAYSDMLNRDVNELTNDDLRAFLSGISSGAERLRRLVENFILLVELETGEAAATYQWRKRRIDDIFPLLREAVQSEKTFADERGVTLSILPPTAVLPEIVGDVEYIKAAVARLIDNGIKFSDKPRPTVTIQASAQADGIAISVTDQGRGVPPHLLEAIFGVFYQIDRQYYEDQGAGAGLPIVRQIVALHKGEIKVTSELGKGSVFMLYLPSAGGAAD